MAKKNMILIILSFFLLCACDTDKKSQEIDWNLEAKYNMVHNDWSTFYSIQETETGIISYYYVNDEDKDNPNYFPLYIADDKVMSLNDDVSSVCGINDFSNCDNLIQITLPIYGTGTFYYKGKIYYFDGVLDDTQQYNDVYINSSNIDGSNQKKEYFLGTFPNMINKSFYGSYIQFHKDKIYANYLNELYIIDLKEDEIKKINFPEVECVWKIFLHEENMYLTTPEYNDGKKVYYNVLLECDLDGNIKNLIEQDKIVLYVDETLLYYATVNDDVYNFYISNRKTGKLMDLEGTSYQYALKYGNQYLFDTGRLGMEFNHMMILDENLNVIHEKDYTKEDYYNDIPLFMGDKYYVIYGLKETNQWDWYGYYEITEEGISEIKKMEGIE